jgi:hypothetical protein
MNHRILLAMTVLALSPGAWSQTLDRPPVTQGDTWTYRITSEHAPNGWKQTHQEITVTHATASSLFLSSKESGSTQPPRDFVMGGDWTRRRDVNGTETVVNRPLTFPLAQGKTWDVAYTEQNPNKQHKSETFESHYTVVGYESIEVPAGQFRALKIEAEGQWHAQLAPQTSIVQAAQTTSGTTAMASQVSRTTERPVSGRLYKAFWYVPEVKRWVKSVEEYYSSGGVRNERETTELESFKMAAAQ